MIAYKGTYNLKCLRQVYEVGETYSMPKKDVELCESGFHFCKKFNNVNSYYTLKDPQTVVVEIKIDKKDIVEEDNTKSVSSRIKILRVVPKKEYEELSDGRFKWENNIFTRKFETNVWQKIEYDKKCNLIRFEDSSGFWEKREYDKKGNKIKLEDSTGFWEKCEYDEFGNELKFENSNGFCSIAYYKNNQFVKIKDVDINGNCIEYE